MHLGAARGHGEEGGGLAFPFPQVDGHVGDRNGGGALLKVRPWLFLFFRKKGRQKSTEKREGIWGEGNGGGGEMGLGLGERLASGFL